MQTEGQEVTEIVHEVRRGREDRVDRLVELLRRRVVKVVENVMLPKQEKAEIERECVSVTLLYAIKTYDSSRAKSFLTYYYQQVRATIWNRLVVLHNGPQGATLRSVSMQDPDLEFLEPYTEPRKELEFRDVVDTVSNSLSPVARRVFLLIVEGHSKTEAVRKAAAPSRVIDEIKENEALQELLEMRRL